MRGLRRKTSSPCEHNSLTHRERERERWPHIQPGVFVGFVIVDDMTLAGGDNIQSIQSTHTLFASFVVVVAAFEGATTDSSSLSLGGGGRSCSMIPLSISSASQHVCREAHTHDMCMCVGECQRRGCCR